MIAVAKKYRITLALVAGSAVVAAVVQHVYG